MDLLFLNSFLISYASLKNFIKVLIKKHSSHNFLFRISLPRSKNPKMAPQAN